MKKSFFKKETVKSKKFLATFASAIFFFTIGIIAIQSRYVAAIDPQEISKSIKNQKESNGGYYSVYELNEKEFRGMVAENLFKEVNVKKDSFGNYAILSKSGNGRKYSFTIITENELAEICQFLQENKVKINFLLLSFHIL